MLAETLTSRLEATRPDQPCRLEVDLDAVAANLVAIRRYVGPRTAVAAVVKADAYGLGAVRVARAALAAGARWLAVARIEEAVALRQAGLGAPILNLAYSGPTELRIALDYRVTLTIADLETARALSSLLAPGEVAPVHLKVDTGLSRFGAQPSELPRLLTGLKALPNLRVEGLFSHLATADEADPGFAREQARRFQAAERLVAEHGFRPRLRHLANSAATLALPETHLDLVRLGITLSGHYPSADVPHTVALRPAVTFKTCLARVYDLPAGASVGYNRTFTAAQAMRAGLVPVGYADGLPRSHSNRGAVLVRGQRAPIVGRVSMDQCVVDLSAIRLARPGDEVVLIGGQGEAAISLDEFATWGDTIGHEALCRIGPRVPRWYHASDPVRGNGRDAQLRLGAAHDAVVRVVTRTS